MTQYFETFSYNRDRGEIRRSGKIHKLTGIQNKLLRFLIRYPDEIHSRSEIMDKVWGRVVSENAVDQAVSSLRAALEENKSNPEIIVTHFGQGFRFVAKSKQQADKVFGANYLIWLTGVLALVFLFFLIWLFLYKEKRPSSPGQQQSITVLSEPNPLLVLPFEFDENISELEQQGMNELLKTFSLSQGKGLDYGGFFKTRKHAIEKHWRNTQSNLDALYIRITKDNEVYKAHVSLTNGQGGRETVLENTSLEGLLQENFDLIRRYRHPVNEKFRQNPEEEDAANEPLSLLHIHAQGYLKQARWQQAEKSFTELLQQQPGNSLARLGLAESLIGQKRLEEAQVQLQTLQDLGESRYPVQTALLNAGILNANKNYQQAADYLWEFAQTHPNLSVEQTAELLLPIADNYLAMGDLERASQFYRLAVARIDAEKRPDLHAISEFGLGKVAVNNSNSDKVTEHFLSALELARNAGDISIQLGSLSQLANQASSTFDWDAAIDFQNQALSLARLTGDSRKLALSLVSLVDMLNLQGKFSEASAVNSQLKQLAERYDTNEFLLYYLHFDVVLSLNRFDWNRAEQQLQAEERLAIESNNLNMRLNLSFLALEILLLKKDYEHFMAEWEKRSRFLEEYKYFRFRTYMDLYLGRFHLETGQLNKANQILSQVIDRAKQSNDRRMLVEAGMLLVGLRLKKQEILQARQLLTQLETYHPHPNPFLELKAKTQLALGNPIEALVLINEARAAYNESWTAENQTLLETIQKAALAKQQKEVSTN